MKQFFTMLLHSLIEILHPTPPPPTQYKQLYGYQYLSSHDAYRRFLFNGESYTELQNGYIFRKNIEIGVWEVRKLSTGWRIADPFESIKLEIALRTGKKIVAVFYEKPPQ